MKRNQNKIMKYLKAGFLALAFFITTSSLALAQTAQPTFSIPAQANFGDTINGGFTNMPSGWAVKLSLNGSDQIFSCNADGCPIQLTSDKGAVVGVNTIIIVKAQDGNGNDISVQPIKRTITLTSNTPSTSNPPPTNSSGNPSASSPEHIINPIGQNDFVSFLISILKTIMGIMGVVAVLFIVIGAFRLITAQGNEEAAEKAKNTITWAIIGMIIALLSFAMVAIVQNLVGVKTPQLPTTQTQSTGK